MVVTDYSRVYVDGNELDHGDSNVTLICDAVPNRRLSVDRLDSEKMALLFAITANSTAIISSLTAEDPLPSFLQWTESIPITRLQVAPQTLWPRAGLESFSGTDPPTLVQ
jgi:hypothetical protein